MAYPLTADRHRGGGMAARAWPAPRRWHGRSRLTGTATVASPLAPDRHSVTIARW